MDWWIHEPQRNHGWEEWRLLLDEGELLEEETKAGLVADARDVVARDSASRAIEAERVYGGVIVREGSRALLKRFPTPQEMKTLHARSGWPLNIGNSREETMRTKGEKPPFKTRVLDGDLTHQAAKTGRGLWVEVFGYKAFIFRDDGSIEEQSFEDAVRSLGLSYWEWERQHPSPGRVESWATDPVPEGSKWDPEVLKARVAQAKREHENLASLPAHVDEATFDLYEQDTPEVTWFDEEVNAESGSEPKVNLRWDPTDSLPGYATDLTKGDLRKVIVSRRWRGLPIPEYLMEVFIDEIGWLTD
jgi:hypothetical protein